MQSLLDSRCCILISGARGRGSAESTPTAIEVRRKQFMSPTAIGCIVFVCIFGGALLGMLLHGILPEHHLSSESKDVIKLGMALTATMSALVLALLVNSAKGSFDTQRNEITQLSANIILLDRVLAHYVPGTKEA